MIARTVEIMLEQIENPEAEICEAAFDAPGIPRGIAIAPDFGMRSPRSVDRSWMDLRGAFSSAGVAIHHAVGRDGPVMPRCVGALRANMTAESSSALRALFAKRAEGADERPVNEQTQMTAREIDTGFAGESPREASAD